MSSELDINDFIRGQWDCSNGVPHQSGKSESYNRGYAAEYQKEQNETAISEMMERERYGH